MSKLWLDFESYCPVPIKHGVHRYAEQAEITLIAWALDDGPVHVHDDTDCTPAPAALRAALQDETVEVWAHNSHFDRTVFRHDWPEYYPALTRWRDTMVQAYCHGLPGSLDALCDVLGVSQDKAKLKDGKALVRLFCQPNTKGERNTRETHPEQWARFMVYAGQDIEAMRECHRIMPKWNYPSNNDELNLWHLDQKINDRGVCIDLPLADASVRAVKQAQEHLARQAQDLTDGAIRAASQRRAMLEHVLENYGVALPDMKAATLERRIADPDLPAALRELLGVRLQASTTSTSKYTTLLRSTSSDGRLRGTLQFAGASRTARWAGRMFQPQNLPRPSMKDAAIELGIEALKADAADLVFSNVMELTSNTIRSCIVAPERSKLVVADLSNIEGRDQAWLAGEQWKLQAFRDFDAGTGHDLYALAYAKSFGVSPEVVIENKKHGDGSMRQIGKVQELALGYEGGVGAFVTFAEVYRVDLETLPAQVLPVADQDLVAEARDFLGWLQDNKGQTFGLTDDAFVACDVLKRAWRRAHPQIASLWRELRDAAIDATDSPGLTIEVRHLKVRRDKNWLRIILPSGRSVCYPAPRVEEHNGKPTLTYMGIDQYRRQWSRLKTYGGKLFENVCQAVARDVMGHNMPAIEDAGYQIVLTVHDEVLTETPESDEFNVDTLADLLASPPPWAADMPLAAAGFETPRYKKD